MEDVFIVRESGARLAAFDPLNGEAVPAPQVLPFIRAPFKTATGRLEAISTLINQPGISGLEHSRVCGIPYRNRKSRPSSGDQIDDQNDERYDQQKVNQASGDMEAETQQPENENDDKDCPKHCCSFFDVAGA
jgi:hypothetical protein